MKRLFAFLFVASLLAVSAHAQFVMGVRDTDGTLTANDDRHFATEKAVKTYVDSHSVPFSTLTVTASTGTLTIANGKTFVVSNGLTLAGTDSTTMTFPSTSATIARTDAANTFTGHQTIEGVTSTGATGTGKFVFDTSPTLVTPVLGVATATTINKVALTAPATGSTITVADGKTLTASNSITLAGTDSTVMTFPSTSATIARTDAANSFTGTQTFLGAAVSSSASAGIGYATGAGGAVTQLTSRVTGVTLNTISGAITTNTTSLAAGASATFTVTDSSVAIGDVVDVSIRSGQTNKETSVRVTAVAAGSFDLTVFNQHASTAETGAIVVNFAVVKAVSS